MSLEDYFVQRSIHVFELVGDIKSNELEKTLSVIESARKNSPDSILFNTGDPTSFLYISDNGKTTYSNNSVLWIKFGWARRSGLPEAVNMNKAGKTEYLRLQSGVYLFEPSHLIIFQHGNRLIMLYEYNFFGPRAQRFCQYMTEFIKKSTGKDKVNLNCRRVFMKDLDKMLRSYDIVKKVGIELEPSALNKLSMAMGGSKTNLEFLKRLNPKKIFIQLKGDELELSIDSILEIFYSLEEEISSFKVGVKKGWLGRTTYIDLKKQVLIFRKNFKYAQDEDGNIYRSTDTRNAIEVLTQTISEAKDAISLE